MNSQAAVVALDRALATAGQPVQLQRLVGPVADSAVVEVVCQAFVRDFRTVELDGGIGQGDSLVILSPTPLVASQWPGAQPGGGSQTGYRLPRKGDRLVVGGQVRTVEGVETTRLAGSVVRIALTVRG